MGDSSLGEAEGPWDAVWLDARLATMTGPDYGAVAKGAIAVRAGRIAWVGPMAAFDRRAAAGAEIRSAGGRWITPGLIDCHTHLIFAGNRADERERRLKGESYAEIARQGGGIRSTVARTRAASEDELVASAQDRLQRLAAEGVTTIEVKSGYGLDLVNEVKMLRAARRLGSELPLTVMTTYLALHALPPDHTGRQAAYVDQVVGEMLPAIARSGLADAVDAFVESIAFTGEEADRLFAAAAELGLAVKLHADQLSDSGGAALAARHRALSADHLEYASEDGVAAMAAAGTVGVLLPGAFLTLGESHRPPIDAFRRLGVAMAVATDCNPGSSPALSLLLMLNLACALFGLTPEEALAGATCHAARALGLDGERGRLAPGQAADFVLWDIDHPAELSYWLGGNPAHQVVVAGRPIVLSGGHA